MNRPSSQPSLFAVSPPPPDATPYAPDSDTSRAAAVKAKAFAGKQALAVYRYILGCGAHGATQKDIARDLCLERASVSARCTALTEAGWIVKMDRIAEGCRAYRAAVYVEE